MTTRIDSASFSARARRLLDAFDRAETGDLRVVTSKGQQEALQALDAEASQVSAPLLRLEHGLNVPVAFGILPLFALCNAGTAASDFGGLAQPVVWGTALGLLVGKTVGITGGFLAGCSTQARDPSRRRNLHDLGGAAVLAGPSPHRRLTDDFVVISHAWMQYDAAAASFALLEDPTRKLGSRPESRP